MTSATASTRMKRFLIHDLTAAAHTPFRADGTFHPGGIERQAEHYLATGIQTTFVGGSTGECHSLSFAERLDLAKRWMEVTAGTPLRVIVHVGSNSLEDARALAAQAEDLGAAAISALAPSYFKPGSTRDLVDWCASITTAAPETPFYFYDIPGMTGVHLSMPDFLEQAGGRIPSLAGIKFTNSDLMSFQLCLRADGGRFDVPYGTDEWLLAALALGAKGAVGSSFNFAAPIYQRMIAAFDAGDMANAREEQFRSVELIRTLKCYGYMGAAKVVMGMLGVPVGPARQPNGNPGPDEIRKLRIDLEALGFFEWTEAAAMAGSPD